jgi:hypothetical protein
MGASELLICGSVGAFLAAGLPRGAPVITAEVAAQAQQLLAAG